MRRFIVPIDYIVNQPTAPIFLKPKLDSELADEAIYGMMVKIKLIDEEWCYIQMEYGYEGWMLLQHLDKDKKSSSDTHNGWKTSRNSIVQSPFADLMPRGTYKGYPLLTLPRGSMVELISENPDKDGWICVKLHNGISGYCRQEWIRSFSDFPDREDEKAIRDAVTSDARSYLGTHYSWGGKTPSGIDCSGLTFMSYWMNGISLYRDASIKPGYLSHHIDDDTKKYGDLLYFPGHIAMYLGNGQYIHSTGSQGGVVINSLDPNSNIYHEELRKTQYDTGSIF